MKHVPSELQKASEKEEVTKLTGVILIQSVTFISNDNIKLGFNKLIIFVGKHHTQHLTPTFCARAKIVFGDFLRRNHGYCKRIGYSNKTIWSQIPGIAWGVIKICQVITSRTYEVLYEYGGLEGGGGIRRIEFALNNFFFPTHTFDPRIFPSVFNGSTLLTPVSWSIHTIWHRLHFPLF